MKKRNDNFIKFIIGKYNELYEKVYKEKYNFSYFPNRKLMSSFFKKIKENFKQVIGEFFYTDFLEFSFNHFLLIRNHKGDEFKIQPHWIFGEKAIIRYKEKKQNYSYSIQKNLKKVENKIEISSRFENLSHEEYYKHLAHDKKDGLFICMQFTTLRSNCQFCNICINRAECVENQKIHYPKLFKKYER